jgi:hypothetical protein
MRTLKTVGLLAIVAAAVLVPLYGEVRGGAVAHPEWARMLLRALDLEDDLPPNATARLLFSTLSWKQSLAYPADRYLRARGVDVVGPDGARHVVASNGAAEVAYPLAVIRAGDYRLRLQLVGDPSQAGSADITPIGAVQPVREFHLAPPAVAGWVDVGATHLDPGGYTAAVVLPAGSALHQIEVAPRCLAPIEPIEGWKEPAVTSAEDVAVTVLQALDLQWELPPAAAAIEIVASDFRAIEAASAGGAVAVEPGQEGLWLKGGARGVQALVIVDLPEAGLYTLSSFGLPTTAQGWLVDSCRKAILCPRPDGAPAGPLWRPVLTADFTAGRHSLAVSLPPGAGLGRVRLERKKHDGPDYVATLARLGFDVGNAGPVARPRAVDAMEFVRNRRTGLEDTACGDVPPPDVLEAGLAEPPLQGAAGPLDPGQPPDDVGVPLPGPEPMPVIPSPPPVTVPDNPSPPPTTPPQPGPPPTTVPPEPPPTVPPQPPGSPVTLPTPPPGV